MLIAINILKNGIINKNNLIPLYILTWKIKCTKIGKKNIEKIINTLFLKLLNFELKKLLSFFKKNIKDKKEIKIKIGILNIKKLKK